MIKYYGFDTETNAKGNIVLMATEKEYVAVKDFRSVLSFFNQPKYYQSIFFSWNLTFDAEGLIKMYLLNLPKDEVRDWREIAEEIKSVGHVFKYGMDRVELFYIKGKFLKLKINKHEMKFYDIAQFYGHKTLESQAKKFLGRGKIDSSDWVGMVKKTQSGEISHEDLEEYFKENYDNVGLYCMLDSELAVDLAMVMKDAFTSCEIPFNNPMSGAKIAENFIMERHTKQKIYYPKVWNNMAEMHMFVKDGYHGGIFETLQRGLFNEPLYDYDINSAYPYTLSKFDHWGNGKFYSTDKVNKDIYYGWYLAEFDCKWIPYVPMLDIHDIKEYRLPEYYGDKLLTDEYPNKRIYYPTGKRIQIITKLEYDFMKKNNFPCQVFGGFEWRKKTDKYESPFSWVKDTYKRRQELKQADDTDMRQYAIKILLNSTYGKTVQLTGSGKLTNFFYGSYITAECRVRVAQVAVDHPNNVIDIATDGICLNCECPELEVSKSELGKWELKKFKGGLFIGSGIRQMFYYEPDDKGNMFETYARGLTEDRSFDLYTEMLKHKDDMFLEKSKFRPLHLGECVSHTKTKGVQDINHFTTVVKRLNVNSDKKHKWSREYTSFKDFLDNKSYATPFTVKDLL